MERLVRIDVADTGDDPLIEQQRLDGCGPSGKPPLQLGRSGQLVQRIRAEQGQRRFGDLLRCVDGHESEGARIHEADLDPAADAHENVGVERFRIASASQRDAPRHAEVGDPRQIAGQVGEHELPVAS